MALIHGKQIKNGTITKDRLDPALAANMDGYVHVQSTPATNWNIVHNMGKHPSITILDYATNTIVEPDEIQYLNVNNTSILFSVAISGEAYCI